MIFYFDDFILIWYLFSWINNSQLKITISNLQLFWLLFATIPRMFFVRFSSSIHFKYSINLQNWIHFQSSTNFPCNLIKKIQTFESSKKFQIKMRFKISTPFLYLEFLRNVNVKKCVVTKLFTILNLNKFSKL